MKKILLGFTLSLCLLTTAASAAVAQESAPSFSFEPAEVTVKPGDTFSTNIVMDTSGQDALGGGAQISYDPDIMTIVEVKPGSIFAEYPAAVFDNESGLAKISGIASGIDDTFKGAGTFGSITWKLNSSEETSAHFVFTPGATTESNIAVTTGNGDILGQVGKLVIHPEGGGVSVGTTETGAETTNSTNANRSGQAAGPAAVTDRVAMSDSGTSMYIWGLLGAVVILIVGGLIFWLMKKKKEEKKISPPSTTTTTVATTVSTPIFTPMAAPVPKPPQVGVVSPQPIQAAPPAPVLPVQQIPPVQPVQGPITPPANLQ